MNPNRFFSAGYIGIPNNIIYNPLVRTINNPMIRPMNQIISNSPKGIGIFSKLTNGIRSVNWGGILNNANKTLNVVNQTIPLVRQAGPMVNNMKSMLKIAKVFGNETTNKTNSIKTAPIISNTNINNLDNNYSSNDTLGQKKGEYNDNSPNFFV